MSILFTFLFNFFMVSKNVDKMYCDIKGNVKNPGVYEVIEGEIINDIIEKAGGLKKNSYVKNINLSKKVTDEMVIKILSIDEYEDLTYKCPLCLCEEIKCESVTTNEIDVTTTFKNITTNKEVATTNVTTTQTTTQFVLLVNINNDDVEELMKLPGIGESIANRIIEYRIENKFLKIEDIKNVKGIGDTLFDKIKEFITV